MASLHLANTLVPAQYDLNLSINHLKSSFSGVATIQLQQNPLCKRPSPVFSLTLAASGIVVTLAHALIPGNLSPVIVSCKTDRQSLRVVFEAEHELPVPQQATLVINYLARINAIKTFSDPTTGLFKTNYSDPVRGSANNFVLATHFQPCFAKTVYPLIEDLSLKVPIKLTITTSKSFTVVSNSPLLSKTTVDSDPALASFLFEPTPPIAPSVFGFVLGNLDRIVSDVTLPLSVISSAVYTPVGYLEGARYASTLVSKFLPILQSLLKVPFPLKKCDFVALPFLTDGAMENWGMVTILAPQLLLDETAADLDRRKLHVQQLVAHELVHQWLGNLTSFDAWTGLWLNEAFATWLGNYVVHLSGINNDVLDHSYEMDRIADMERLMDADCLVGKNDSLMIPSIYQYTVNVAESDAASTASIFDNHAYQKGMALLTMVGNAMNPDATAVPRYDRILENVADNLIAKHKFASIKPMDFWSCLVPVTAFDAHAFAFSWQQHQGYPLVTVKTNPQRTSVVFEQHIHLHNLSVGQVLIEDAPFHVPLRVKVAADNGQVRLVNVLLTDRSLKLDIPLDQFLVANSNRAGYFRVHYSPEIIVDSIVPAIKKGLVLGTEILALIYDYTKFVGTAPSTSDHLALLLKIINVLPDVPGEIDWFVWETALSSLLHISELLRHFSDFIRFSTWTESFIARAMEKVGDWDSILKSAPTYSTVEMKARNIILLLGLDMPSCQAIALKLYRNFTGSTTSSHRFIPREIITSVFCLVMRNASQKEYKRVLELVKNNNSSLLPHTNLNAEELLTVALQSLLFVRSDQLATKALNFINSNLNCELIELGLNGYRFAFDKADKLRLFNWYKLQYDLWVRQAQRSEPERAKHIGASIAYITRLVLCKVMQHDAELIKLKREFVAQKLSSLAPHGLQEILESEEANEEEGKIVGGFYDDVIKLL